MDFPWILRKTIELGHHSRWPWLRVTVPLRERSTHTYVVGVTGKGKSKLLEHLLFQDIVHGRGCGVLDPHGDLVHDLMHCLLSQPARADRQWQRIIYLDPTRSDYVVPFNVLRSGVTPYETAQNVVEAFRRTWPRALEEAPRFANITVASALTLIANNLTLVEMPRLLSDRSFRDKLLQQVDDPEVIHFWHERYELWGRETARMVESVLNKVTAFTLNPYLRRLLGNPENRLDFRLILDQGQVLLVDLGNCDTETRRLVGSLLVTGLEQAARSRRNHTGPRSPYFFVIDEFQDFCANEGAAQTLAQILSECRKFGLHLTLAHQSLAQLSERMQGALGNVQLKMVFGVARADAEVLAKQLFWVDGEKVKHQVRDPDQLLRSHPVFYSVQEEWEQAVQRLQQLPAQQVLVQRPGQRQPIQMKTVNLRYRRQSMGALEKLKLKLLRQWGEPADEQSPSSYGREALTSSMRGRRKFRERVNGEVMSGTA